MESNITTTFKQNQRVYSKEEIEIHQGKYDQDGFYLLLDGDFFDQAGYYFDKEGLDEKGGFYDENTGVYQPPPEFNAEEDLDDYYDELCGSESEEEAEEQEFQGPGEDSSDEEDDKNQYQIEEKDENKEIRREHCIPALQWLKDQETGKKHVIKIANVPRRASKDMLLRQLQKKIKGLKYEIFGIEKDEKCKDNYGIAYISSTDLSSITQLVKLHYHIYAGYKLRTYLMGFPYDTMEDAYEHTPFQKKIQQLSLQQLKQRQWLRRKFQESQQNTVQQEQKQKADQIISQMDDDYGVEEFKS